MEVVVVMKKYEVPMLEVDQEEIFTGVPDDLFDDAMLYFYGFSFCNSFMCFNAAP